MILSTSKKFIFIKTRKCGGTSIQETLKPFCNDDDYVTLGHKNLTKNLKKNNLNEFSTLEDIKTLNYDINEYFKFSIVRNPYDLVLSRFFFNIKKNRIKISPNKENFNNWVINNFINKSEYEMDKYSKLILNKNNLIVDYVCKLENIRLDFEYIKEKLDLPKNLNVLHKNVSNDNKINYSDWYLENTKNKIKNLFDDELSYFKYEF